MASTVLSASTLSLFLECPRCFYLHAVRGVKRPSGPFPSLPSGMDALIKEHFDRYRAAGALPPEVVGLVDGALFPDQRTLDAWRSSRRGLRTNLAGPGVTLTGALDECLVSDGRYVPVDFKTRGYERKGDTDRLYQHQLDIYALLLDENGRAAAILWHLILPTLAGILAHGPNRLDERKPFSKPDSKKCPISRNKLARASPRY